MGWSHDTGSKVPLLTRTRTAGKTNVKFTQGNWNAQVATQRLVELIGLVI